MKIGQGPKLPAEHAERSGRIREILHPTAFTEGCEQAFVHALRLALAFGARLRILHVDAPGQASDARLFPRVVDTLVRWGRLPDGATDADLAGLCDVETIVRVGTSPTREILAELPPREGGLVVLSTRGLEGLERLRDKSVAEPIVRHGGVPTLLFPPGVRGFVDSDDGTVDLTRILVPVEHGPGNDEAVALAAGLADALEQDIVQLSTLHVGDGAPEVALPAREGWTIRRWHEDGAVVEGIVETAVAWAADLVVMVSRPVRRSRPRRKVLEHVLARTLCPVLEVPAAMGAEARGAETEGAETKAAESKAGRQTPEPVGG